jgi:hypothetical protein
MGFSSKYTITVSEPWDYESPNGTNAIHGRLVKEVSSDCVIFKSDVELDFDGHKGKLLVLQSRYENKLIKHNGSYHGTVCAGLLLSEKLNVPLSTLEKNSKYVFIGSFEKIAT